MTKGIKPRPNEKGNSMETSETLDLKNFTDDLAFIPSFPPSYTYIIPTTESLS